MCTLAQAAFRVTRRDLNQRPPGVAQCCVNTQRYSSTNAVPATTSCGDHALWRHQDRKRRAPNPPDQTQKIQHARLYVQRHGTVRHH